MDFYRIKCTLLSEYVAAGGTNKKDFIHGMNYLIDFLESGREPEPLNAEVDDILFLKGKIAELQEEVAGLKEKLKHKNVVINNYREMSKQERAEVRKSKEFFKIEQTYSRMILELEKKYNGGY